MEKIHTVHKEEQQAWIAIPIVMLAAVGIAWAGSQGGHTVAGLPIFALDVALTFGVQWLAFVPAYLKRTESFYDLTGSLTYILVMIVSLSLIPIVDARTWLLAMLIIVWASRLGYFLFSRIRAAGDDRRFREIKKSPARFLLAWTLQGLWIALTLSAALAAITSLDQVPFDTFAITGLLVWTVGFALEVAADWQKRVFREKPENRDRFIRTGLWAWSRHPNYFGEIMLWTGVALIALPILRGWQYVTLISPLFVTILLTKISGIPMLENYADQKWGGQPEYEEYKTRTSILFLKPPKDK